MFDLNAFRRHAVITSALIVSSDQAVGCVTESQLEEPGVSRNDHVKHDRPQADR